MNTILPILVDTAAVVVCVSIIVSPFVWAYCKFHKPKQ